MTTNERAEAVARACHRSGLAWKPDREQLLGLVEAELGHAEALDRFVPHGDLSSLASPLTPIVHILAGNSPDAAIQTLTRGLLVGARNQVKLPSGGIPEVDFFLTSLPQPLAELVDTTTDRTRLEDWLQDAAAVIAFGADQTLWAIRAQLGDDQVFVPHGHRFSLAVIDADPKGDAARLAARDISTHDQRGCLSPHDIYVAPGLQPRSFAAQLARELADCPPPDKRSDDELAEIDHLRRSYGFRASADTSVQIWQSEGNADWTVVFEEESQFAASPTCRFAFVKPLPTDLRAALPLVRDHLSTIAIHPFTMARAEQLTGLGAPRLCALGRAQTPSPFWHHDGMQVLAPLVRWTDAG